MNRPTKTQNQFYFYCYSGSYYNTVPFNRTITIGYVVLNNTSKKENVISTYLKSLHKLW